MRGADKEGNVVEEIEELRNAMTRCLYFTENEAVLSFCLFCRTCEILDGGGIVSEGGGRDLEGRAVAPPARRRAVERADDAGGVEHARQQDPF